MIKVNLHNEVTNGHIFRVIFALNEGLISICRSNSNGEQRSIKRTRCLIATPSKGFNSIHSNYHNQSDNVTFSSERTRPSVHKTE